jgi:hypothetical protein
VAAAAAAAIVAAAAAAAVVAVAVATEAAAVAVVIVVAVTVVVAAAAAVAAAVAGSPLSGILTTVRLEHAAPKGSASSLVVNQLIPNSKRFTMSDTPGGTQKRSSLAPWLIGCGLVFVLAIVGLGGAGYYLWTQSVFTEDADINAVATEIIPGAKAPDGLEPIWAMDMNFLGMKMAVFGESGMEMGGGAPETGMMIVVASGETGKGAVIGNTMQNSAGEGNEVRDAEEIGEEVLKVGGVDITFKKSRGKQQDVAVMLYVAEFPTSAGRQPMVLIMGPEEKFDHKVMDAFLAAIGPLEKSDTDRTDEPDSPADPEGKPESGAGEPGKAKKPDPGK